MEKRSLHIKVQAFLLHKSFFMIICHAQDERLSNFTQLLVVCMVSQSELMMRISPLSLTIKSLLATSLIGTAAANNNEPADVNLGTVVVTVSADASSVGLKKAHAGGQFAKGSRVGILGNKDVMDTPFSTTAYTQKFIKDTQADSVGEVLKKDPTVQLARGYGNFQEAYMMRGFVTYSDDTMYNGLYGIMPRQYTAGELFERVEIQRGASAALNGVSPGGANTGGTITLLPKRAGNNPKKELTISYESDGQVKVAADVGQRFVDNKVGVRVNAAYGKGDGAVSGEEKETKLISVGSDYRGEKLRVSFDVGHQEVTDTTKRSSVDVNAATVAPKAVNAKTNWTQNWANTQSKDTFATVRGEYDFNDNITAFAAYGMRQGEENNVLGGGFFYLTDGKTGDGYYTSFDNNRKDDIKTGELGIKGNFQTGKLSHAWTLTANAYQAEEKNATVWDWSNQQANNLYSPTQGDKPALSAAVYRSGGSLDNPSLTATTKLNSIALANTIGALDDDLQLTLGARYQAIKTQDHTWNTHYDDSKVSPVFAANYRFAPSWSAFANYSEKLTAGKNVSINASTQMLKPYVSKQAELGVKYDQDGIGATASVFQIKEPRASLANGNADTKGDNVHQGLEVMVYGAATPNLRLNTGFTVLDAKQRDTDDAFDGKTVIGAAKFNWRTGAEYDLDGIEGLTLTGDVLHTGSRYAKADNSLKIDGYTLLNLGARYHTELGAVPVTLRGNVENVFNTKHWASVGGYPGQGYLVAGEPRTVKVSASFDF